MNTNAPTSSRAARRERVTIERTYQAAIEDVWEMWTTKDGIESWWGPDGFAVTVRSIDLRAGGVLDYTMRATDQGQIEFMEKAGMPLAIDHRLEYTEVTPPKHLAFSHYADFIPGVEPYEVTHVVELEATRDGVRVTVAIDRMHDDYWTEMAVKGWTSELEKLAKALAAEGISRDRPSPRRPMANKIAPFLWFDDNAEAAMNFYVSVFPNSRAGAVSRYGDEGLGPKDAVISASCVLNGQEFLLLNGGPRFKFTEAVSFLIHCDDQREVDHYWDALIAGGGAPSQCGWLKDKFGLSWQVVPRVLSQLMSDTDRAKAGRVMQALLKMTKIDVAELQRAHAGR